MVVTQDCPWISSKIAAELASSVCDEFAMGLYDGAEVLLMTTLIRNESTTSKLTPSRNLALKAVLISSLVGAIATSAFAQSSAASTSDITYGFQLNPNSFNQGPNLSVSDLGMHTYNLFNSDYATYAKINGMSSAYGTADPSSTYSNVSWSGWSAVMSGAVTSAGKAAGSAGVQESVMLSNTGTDKIFLDVNALGHAFGSAAITGAVGPYNYASVNTYVGIYDFNITTLTAMSNPLVHIYGDSTGLTTSVTSDWSTVTTSTGTEYDGHYLVTLNPGETHFLSFYSSGKVIAAANNAVPAPAAALSLLTGLIGTAIRRRKSA